MPVSGLLLALTLLSSSPPEPTGPAPDTGAVEIQVLWEGEVPETPPVRFPPSWTQSYPDDAGYCENCQAAGTLRDESLIVGAERGVANVAASFPGLPAIGHEPPPAVRLDNKGCRFEPHVQFLLVGQTMNIVNSDPFTHNARIDTLSGRAAWNGLIPVGREVETPKILRRGIYRVTCGLHPWMGGWVIAVQNRSHAVTDLEGKARIDGIPSGTKQSLALWHETLGIARRDVLLEPGETLHITLSQKDFQ